MIVGCASRRERTPRPKPGGSFGLWGLVGGGVLRHPEGHDRRQYRPPLRQPIEHQVDDTDRQRAEHRLERGRVEVDADTSQPSDDPGYSRRHRRPHSSDYMVPHVNLLPFLHVSASVQYQANNVTVMNHPPPASSMIFITTPNTPAMPS